MHISVVSPVYKAPKILTELVERLYVEISQITESFEVILVDDGCPLNSWTVIEELSQRYSFVKGIKLSRNFGQHYAITAGLDHTQGDWIVVMDCDLQDQPEEIYKLYQKAKSGADIVLGMRYKRKDNLYKTALSKLFYSVLSLLTDKKYDPRTSNFGIYSRKVIDSVLKFREPIQIFPVLISHIGFNIAKIPVEHSNRKEGTSSYNLNQLFRLSINIILAYSDKPLRLIIRIGLMISLLSFTFAAFSIWQWLNNKILVPGFTSLITSIWFLSGIIISTLGIIGLYLGKIFESSKQRPLYLVKAKLNIF
jgi:glycosyltransferase involved in cell wall biosynthesis